MMFRGEFCQVVWKTLGSNNNIHIYGVSMLNGRKSTCEYLQKYKYFIWEKYGKERCIKCEFAWK